MKQPAAFLFLFVCLFAVGCNKSPLLTWTEQQCTQIERLTKLLNEIDSPAAADERLDDVRQCYVAMIRAKREGPALFRKHAQDKVLKSTTEALKKRSQKAERESTLAVEKLDARNDLSEPFCSMMKMQSVEFMIATVEMMQEVAKIQGAPRLPVVADLDTSRQLLKLYEQHGPANVVEVEIKQGGAGAAQTLIDAADGDATGLVAADQATVVVGPVNDFDAYRSKLASHGTVSDVDPGMRSFVFSPSHASPPRNAPDHGPVARHDSSFDNLFEPDMTHDERVQAIEQRHDQHVADAQRRAEDMRREALADFNSAFDAEPAATDWRAADSAGAADSPWAEEEDEPAMRTAQPTAQPAWPTGRMASAASPTRTTAAKPTPLQNLTGRDKQQLELAEALNSDDRIALRTAAVELLDVPPSSIRNSDVRRMVARGYRALLKDPHYMMSDGETAIRGLEMHAGKHSVPLVIEYLNTNPLRVPPAAVQTLREHSTPEGIVALIKLLGVTSASEAATAALREAGPDAEAPLLAVVLKLDPTIMPQALELLGDVGSPKSYRVLKIAARKSHPGVRSAANDSLRRIQQRN